MSGLAINASVSRDETGSDERALRILVTVPWGERLGGAEMMLHTLLNASRGYPHQFELVFFADGPWPRELADAGFTVTVIEAGRLRQTQKWVSTVVRLVRLLRARQPTVVLNWMAKTHLYGGPAAMLAGMRDRVIWWQHGIPSYGWLDRLATALPAAAIGTSSRAGARAQARLRPHRHTFVVHPGTVASSPKVEPTLALADGVVVVGIVGRLQPWKRQDRVLRAHALLRDRGYALHTLIVGGDAYGLSPSYARRLQELIADLNLDGAVTMTGQVPDARPYIQRMDVLVNASDSEPFGLVLLEAMAEAVAVVAVANGGPAEFIEDGKTGVLARSSTPTDLAVALEMLVSKPNHRRSIGAAGQARFVERYSEHAMCDRFFRRIMDVGGHTHPSHTKRADRSAHGVGTHIQNPAAGQRLPDG